jgi:hypothetical protein
VLLCTANTITRGIRAAIATKAAAFVCSTACGALCCSANASVSKQQQRVEFRIHVIPFTPNTKTGLRTCIDSEALLGLFLALEQGDVHTRAANLMQHAAENALTANPSLHRDC